jgi:Mg2+ and Co2+ transporter CorA
MILVNSSPGEGLAIFVSRDLSFSLSNKLAKMGTWLPQAIEQIIKFNQEVIIMSTQEKVSLTLSINKEYRDRLRTMAAQQNLNDPNQLTSASTLAREIICEYIDAIERLEVESREVEDDVYTPTEAELNEVFESVPDKKEEGQKNE